jgi:hypothetical protein
MNGYTGIAPQQLQALGQGKYNALSTHFSDNAHEIVQVQADVALTNHLNQILAGLGTVVETADPGYILEQLIHDMGLKESAELAGVNLNPVELQALVSKKEDFKETVEISAKEINRNNAVALARQSDRTTLNLVRRLLHLLIEALDRVHNSVFDPFHNSVDPATVNEVYRSSFGALNRGTAAAADVLAQAVSVINTAGYFATMMLVPPSVIPRLDAGDEVALNTNYVGDNGFLTFTSPRARFAKTFGGLAVMPSTGNVDDPLISHVCNPEHLCNSAMVCGSFDRGITAFNHENGYMEAVNLRAAVDASRLFDRVTGRVSEDVYSVVEQWNMTRRTPWHDQAGLKQGQDPVRGVGMGPLTYFDRAGQLVVSNLLGHMPNDRVGLQRFGESVMENLGVRKSQVIADLLRLEAVLKDSQRAVPSNGYWAAVYGVNGIGLNNNNAVDAVFAGSPADRGNATSEGALRNARGNAYGVLNHPAFGGVAADGAAVAADPAFETEFHGFINGPGIAFLAAQGRNSQTEQLKEMGRLYDSAQALGTELSVVLPESQFFSRRPSWYNGEYTPGMGLIDSLLANNVPLMLTGVGAGQAYTFRDGQGLAAADIPNYLADVTRTLDAAPAAGGARSLAEAQTDLIALLNANSALRADILPVLNRVAGVAAAGGDFAGIATIDVRAANVLTQVVNAAGGPSADEVKAVMHLMLSLWDQWPGETTSISAGTVGSAQLEGTREIIQRVAAAFAQGNSPVGQADVGAWFQSTPSAALADSILDTYPLAALAANANADDIRLPLTLGGGAIALAGLPNNIVPANPTNPNQRRGGAIAQADTTARAVRDIFDTAPFGAQFGAGGASSSSSTSAAQRVVDTIAPKVFKDNSDAANGLNTAHKVAARALLHTPLTAGSLKALVDAIGAYYPFSWLLYRATNYKRSLSAFVLQGGAENLQVRHDPLQVIQGFDTAGSKFIANLNLSAIGIVLIPAATIKLPHFHLSNPVKKTGDLSMRNSMDVGAFIPSIVPLNYDCPEELPLNGLDHAGNLINPSAVLTWSLFDLESFAPAEFMWKKDSYVSYQAKQHTRDHYGAMKMIASKGPSCVA